MACKGGKKSKARIKRLFNGYDNNTTVSNTEL